MALDNVKLQCETSKRSSIENKTRTFSYQKRLLVYKHYICFVRLNDLSIKITFGLKNTTKYPQGEKKTGAIKKRQAEGVYFTLFTSRKLQMNPSKLSREWLYFNCSLKFIYSTLNQINSSKEINTIYTVYMSVDDGRTILVN